MAKKIPVKRSRKKVIKNEMPMHVEMDEKYKIEHAANVLMEAEKVKKDKMLVSKVKKEIERRKKQLEEIDFD